MHIITQHVPICPNCSAMLFKRHQASDIFFVCADCLQIFRLIGTGEAEIELKVTDKAGDEDE